MNQSLEKKAEALEELISALSDIPGIDSGELGIAEELISDLGYDPSEGLEE